MLTPDASYDESGGEGELQNSGSIDSIAPAEPATSDTPAGAGNLQSPASGVDLVPDSQPNSPAPSSQTRPCPTAETTTCAINTPTTTAPKTRPKDMEEKCASDVAEADEEQDHVCAKVQSLESKVARLERTVSLLTKMIERSRSIRQNLQKQNAHPIKEAKDDHVDPPRPSDTTAM